MTEFGDGDGGAWDGARLLLQHCLEGLDRVGLLGALVEAISLYPGESEGDAARVPGAGLDAVDRHFHHLFGAKVDGPPVAADLEFGEPSRFAIGGSRRSCP